MFNQMSKPFANINNKFSHSDRNPVPISPDQNLHFRHDFIGKSAPVKYLVNTKIKSCGKVISSCPEDFKTMLHAFFLEPTLLLVTPGVHY